MLEKSIRQIAIQTIATRATGTPVEAVEQILKGISALDFPGKPFVIWPTNLSSAEQIEVLESELGRIRHASQAIADYWATSELHPQADSSARLEHQGTQSYLEVSDMPVAEVSCQPIPGEAKEGAALRSAQKPDRGASDASQ